jgi:hypothetical protein
MRGILIVAAAVTALAVVGGGAALADPSSAPSLDTLVGVNCPPLFDNGNPGGQPGTLVHDYDATHPTYPVACWDPVNPATGVPNGTITAKAFNSTDTSCQLTRPDGSSAGITALNADQTDAHKDSSGHTVPCIDFTFSDRPPNTTTFRDVFAVLARDGNDWAYPVLSGRTNPQPVSLTPAQLVAIYTCAVTNWDQVGGADAPIGVVLPQTGSGTRANWLQELGITASSEPCWENGTITVNGTTYVIEENTGLSTGNVAAFTKTHTIDGVAVPPQDVIFPYSIGDYIAQGAATHGVGGHASSVWGHGNLALGEIDGEVPVTTNSAGKPVINPKWPSRFLVTLYDVARNGCPGTGASQACWPTSPPYEAIGLPAFLGAKGWVCKNAVAQGDIASYGFTNLKNCGALTAGD